MVDTEIGSFTIGVFQDAAWAARGLDALVRAGFAADTLSIVVKEGPEATTLIERTLGGSADRLELPRTGVVLARGAILGVLQGPSGDLPRLGLAGTMGRVGFQAHDGRIFETLTARGGVLVAVQSEPRAADALTILHNYGGGNAAIGAWRGRL